MRKLSLLILAVSVLSISATKLIINKNNMIEIKSETHRRKDYKVCTLSKIDEMESKILKLPYREEETTNADPIKSYTHSNIDKIIKLND